MNKQKQLNRLAERIMSCEKCPRLRDVTPTPYPHIILAEDYGSVRYMCVGRNPGLEHSYDKVSKKGFMRTYQRRWVRSKAGRYMIEKTGLMTVKEQMIWTNVCKCSSPENSWLKDKEVENCKVYLEKQIKIINPQAILTFGNDALKWFFPKESLKKSHTKKLPLGNGRILIPLYHYAYFARTKDIKKNKRQNKVFKDIWL